jgi:hypothetical protein
LSRVRDVVLVHLDDCPHWRTADSRVKEAMYRAGLDPASLRHRSVASENAPADHPGSPTILVDGRDPFPTAVAAGPTCRRFATETGPDGAPTVAQLVNVLEGEEP